jgi:hypothetical protein
MRKIVLLLVAIMAIGCGKDREKRTVAPAIPSGTQNQAGQPVATTTPAVTGAPGEPFKQEIRIPAGTRIQVRLVDALDARKNEAGDRFSATLDREIKVDGMVVLPQGTLFSGHVTQVGPKSVGLGLDTFTFGRSPQTGIAMPALVGAISWSRGPSIPSGTTLSFKRMP